MRYIGQVRISAKLSGYKVDLINNLVMAQLP